MQRPNLLLSLSLALCVLLGSTRSHAAGSVPSRSARLTQYVNPRIGTGAHGHTFLGANVPFGFVQAGPTEPTRGWDWCSGYHDSDSVLVGFSQMHLSGTGIGELGDVTLLPVSRVGQDSTVFSHADETVRPGYYALQLHDPEVKVELTATKRAAFHRYTFSPGAPRLLKIDLKCGIGWDKLVKAGLRLAGDGPTANAVSGYRFSTGWAKDQRVFFHAEFSTGVTIVSMGDNSVVLSMADTAGPVLVKIGLSAVSEENARMNLEAELPGWNFDGTVSAADQAWNDHLGLIKIDTDDADARTVFYTAMYHEAVAPSVFSDVNGDYRGSDGKVHNGRFTNYTTLSLWDTYRAQMPLMTIIHPEMMPDMAETFLHIQREQGKLPVWHLMGNETDCMVGNSGVIIMADLVLKGFVKDKEAAYQAMKASVLQHDRGLDVLQRYGYLPFDVDTLPENVARALEYAIADNGVAKVAKLLGHEDDYRYFHNRAQSYRRLFDPSDRFLKAVDSKGNFRKPFDPFKSIHRLNDYTEGNAWQYLWLVPHDVQGLVSLFPSKKAFEEKLDSLFIVQGDLGEDASPDISGLIGQYAHGNEPSHHILYLYACIGKPWKGARLIRQVMREQYRNSLDGLSGNEDVGQMSAWYILSALGFYQVDPSGGDYMIGSPLFRKATVSVGGGRTFTVEAQGNSARNIYVKSATLNGKPLKGCAISYADIMRGGTLTLKMGSRP